MGQRRGFLGHVGKLRWRKEGKGRREEEEALVNKEAGDLLGHPLLPKTCNSLRTQNTRLRERREASTFTDLFPRRRRQGEAAARRGNSRWCRWEKTSGGSSYCPAGLLNWATFSCYYLLPVPAEEVAGLYKGPPPPFPPCCLPLPSPSHPPFLAFPLPLFHQTQGGRATL